MNKVDYIIVGQGLAGTILAFTLLKKKKSVLIIDEASLSSCSKVAAGNYNPIVFKRLVKSWKADDVIPFADDFFREAQQFLNAEFFWKKEIVKIFADERENYFWNKKSQEEDKYLSKENLTDFGNEILQPNAGFGIVKDAGKIYSAGFVGECLKYFMQENILLNEKFEFNSLHISTDSVKYKNTVARKIIFCEGWMAMQNPYFSFLPFKPAKGEILVLKIENFICDKIIHKNGYLYGIGNGLFVAGSTYEWNELNDIPTENGKKIILEKLERIIRVPYKIMAHYAGVRPSTQDRRPFIGIHPRNGSVGIFNGFGTKAVMLAPFFANQFFNFLESSEQLDSEVNIERFSNYISGVNS